MFEWLLRRWRNRSLNTQLEQLVARTHQVSLNLAADLERQLQANTDAKIAEIEAAIEAKNKAARAHLRVVEDDEPADPYLRLITPRRK